MTGLAGVCLAAGAGTRLRPLTALVPKPLCPVANRALLSYALERLAAYGLAGPDQVAVNAHHLAALVRDYAAGRALVSVEERAALGTAGALGALRGWLGGRDVVVTNADAYVVGDVAPLLAGWDRCCVRLLVVPADPPTALGPWEYAGVCALPGRVAAALPAAPASLYDVCWRPALDAGSAQLVPLDGVFVDCGTPASYLAANVHAVGGHSVVDPTAVVTGTVTRSVVGAGAVVAGTVTESVIWPGETVTAGEHLVRAIRAAGTTLTPATRPLAR